MLWFSIALTPGHLRSSKARSSSVSAIGLQRPGVINFERAGVCTNSLEIPDQGAAKGHFELTVETVIIIFSQWKRQVSLR